MRAFGVYIAIAVGVYLVGNAWQADRDGSGAIVGEGSLDAFQMRIGDCFDDSSTSFGDGEEEVTSVPAVPCADPHDNEVYAVFDVDEASFPGGDGGMAELAFDACLERFETFVGKDYPSSSLDIVTLYPTHASWHQHDDREVVCAVFDMNLNKLVGSVEGSAQ